MTEQLKQCSRCKEWKPATNVYFYERRRYGRVGLRAKCKPCMNIYNKETRDPVKRREYEHKWAAENREKRRKSCRDWRARNLEEQRERERLVKANDPNRYVRNRLWHANNPEKARRQRRRYARGNRSKLNAILHQYIARKAGLPDDFSENDWRLALEYFGGRCAVCGRQPGFWHTLAMDHWIPLNSPDCPGTIPANIVPLCHGRDGCNNSKHDKDPYEWLRQKYGAKKARAILNHVHTFFSQARQVD